MSGGRRPIMFVRLVTRLVCCMFLAFALGAGCGTMPAAAPRPLSEMNGGWRIILEDGSGVLCLQLADVGVVSVQDGCRIHTVVTLTTPMTQGRPAGWLLNVF